MNQPVTYMFCQNIIYIYINKFSNKRLHIQGFRILLKQKLRSEKYIASIYGRLDQFFKKMVTYI